MAEKPTQRFYCHMCNVQFDNPSTNYTCPHCSNSFIEELESGGDNPEEIIEITDSDDDNYQVDLLFIGSLRRRHIDRARFALDPTRRRRYASVHPRSRIRPRTLTRLASTHLRQPSPHDNIFQEFVENLGLGVNWGGDGNMQVSLGYTGDYAWGREGRERLDAIVTQLLNQMDTSEPPPLSRDVIDALPTVEVTQNQVDSKLQCSVCWGDFGINEKVRQLPCQHVYHELCIRPWLELHGTCPICRQNLVSNDQQANAEGNEQVVPDNLIGCLYVQCVVRQTITGTTRNKGN